MRSPLFIARRIYFSKDREKQVSPPAIRIAVMSMALGLAVMLLSVAIVIGFKKEVRNKVIGFGSHIQITHFDSNTSYETRPIAVSDTLLNELRAIPNIRHIQAFATKPAIMKTDSDFQGVVLKGVDEHFDWNFFKKNLIEGSILNIRPDSTNNQVLISAIIADKLKLKTGDSFICYFIQDPPRARKYTIAGIYQTNFADYDKLFILGDIRQIRRLSDWDDDMVSGLELLVNDYDHLDATLETVYYDLSTQTDRLGNHYYPQSIKQLNPMIFAWLDVLDVNVVVILLLMALVAGFSMISGLLIIILERANLIGLLKAMGENNTGIRKIFLYLSVFLIGKGLLWGNLIAFSICIIQKYTGILKLNPDIYYVSQVPVEINIWSWILINLGTLVVTLLMLIGPSYLVAKISPATTIRFE
ncbi:ABC transporter permease [Bacteroidia bacterium]|nr:ABC transporter permease [Bacteroidia bacterium]